MIRALLIAAYATGWRHLPDIVVLRLVEGALHPIEQSTPVGGDRWSRELPPWPPSPWSPPRSGMSRSRWWPSPH